MKITEEHINRYLNSLEPEFAVKAMKYINEFRLSGSLDGYITYIKSKYKSGTVRFIYGILHRLYTINNLPWPYKLSDVPVVSERDVFAPIFDQDLVVEMISAAKDGWLTQRQSFYLAIATTYGCRCIELSSLSKDDFDLKGRLIYIATRKHGRERYHLIPEEIVPVLEKYLPRLHPTTVRTMHRIFHSIEEAIDFDHINGVGWHSFRRCLAQALMRAGLSKDIVTDFMRWKRPARDMAERYARGTIIGRDTQVESIAMQDREIDETVFKVHPFLKHWSVRSS